MAAAEEDPFASLDDLVVESFNGEGYPLVASSYTLTAMLGSGAYADVYRAYCMKSDGEQENVAVKILDLQGYQGSIRTLTNEVHLLKLVKHENLLSILASFVVESELWIVTPLLSGGSCRQLMEVVAPSGFEDEKIIAKVLHNALEGIAYLHKNNMIHRDIKAGNMLISESGCVKVADFGASARMLMGGAEQTPQTLIGTPCWMAPEVVQQASGYSLKADIWSLGITALELAFGAPPYAQEEAVKIMLNILLQEPPSPDTYADQTRAAKCSKLFRQFVARCLQKDPSKRPTAQELMKDKFIKQVAKKNFDNYLKENIPWQLLPTNYLGGDQNTPLVRPKVQAKKEVAYVNVGSWAFASQDLDGAFDDDIIAGKQVRQQSLADDRVRLQQALQQPASAEPQPQPRLPPQQAPPTTTAVDSEEKHEQQAPAVIPSAVSVQTAQPPPQPQPPGHTMPSQPQQQQQQQSQVSPQAQPPPVAVPPPAALPAAESAAAVPRVISMPSPSAKKKSSGGSDSDDGGKRKKKESRFIVTREP